MWFRLSASLKEIESIDADPIFLDAEPIETARVKVGSKFVVTGKVLSHIVFVSNRGVRAFTEINDFTVNGVDFPRLPGEGNDSFVLKFTYSTKGIRLLLLDVFGSDSGLVECPDDKDTCTLTLQGTVQFGDMRSHTSGGD
jgi:hypothetical protein